MRQPLHMPETTSSTLQATSMVIKPTTFNSTVDRLDQSQMETGNSMLRYDSNPSANGGYVSQISMKSHQNF